MRHKKSNVSADVVNIKQPPSGLSLFSFLNESGGNQGNKIFMGKKPVAYWPGQV